MSAAASAAAAHARAPGAPAGTGSPATLGPPAERANVRRALAAALGLGLLGDVLLRGVPLGLNLVAWTAAALAAAFALARRQGRPVTVAAGLLAALALAFAACTAWRDAGTLAGLALLGLVSAACALARALRDGTAWAFEHADVAAYAAGAWAVAGEVAAGARTLGADRGALGQWSRTGSTARAAAVGVRGALLAAPVLAVFGLLLVAADGAFARLAARTFSVDLTAAAGHVAWTAAGAWAAAGYLAGALFSEPPGGPAPRGDHAPRRWRPRVGAAEVCVALALVDALLLAFVAVQLGRLAGGRAAAGTAGLAEYARRGFFELSAVVALALPLLVAASAAVAHAPGGAAARRPYRAAAGLLVALLGALVLSAADRMRLYQAAYGLTELRVYVLAFLAWLAAAFAWAAATLLRGRPAAFALGGTALGWLWVLGLHALDPAALVVRVNAARAAVAPAPVAAAPGGRRPGGDGEALDVAYLASLGADAVPGLVGRVLPRVAAAGPEARCAAAGVLAPALARAEAGARGGWRSWNLARRRAARAAAGARGAGAVGASAGASAGAGAPGAWRDRCAALGGGPRPPAPGAQEAGAG